MEHLSKRGVVVVRCVLVILLIAPVVMYVGTFGIQISSDHVRWAEMGSAMSGIYGPILTILTISLLIYQLFLQGETNKHIYDQAYLQQADTNVAFYLDRLEKALKSIDADGKRSGELLESAFKDARKLAELRTQPAVATANYLNRKFPEIFAAWSAFQAIIKGLEAGEEHSYRLSLTSGKQRAIVVLSYGMCVTLDNYSWCLNEERTDVPYLFSALFRR